MDQQTADLMTRTAAMAAFRQFCRSVTISTMPLYSIEACPNLIDCGEFRLRVIQDRLEKL